MSTLMNRGLLALCGADTAPAAAPAAADPVAPVASAAAPGLLPKVDPHSVLGTIGTLYQIGSLVSAPLLAYHGYKRHDGSFLWGLGWWLLPVPWPVMLGIAVGQSRPEGLWLGGKYGLAKTPSEGELSSAEHAAAGRRRS